MNVSFGKIVKLNIPEANKRKIDTIRTYSGYSTNAEGAFDTLGGIKSKSIVNNEFMRVLIGDDSDISGDSSVHSFKKIDGDIYMVSGKDYNKIADIEKDAIDRIHRKKRRDSRAAIGLVLDTGDFKNRSAAKIQQEYKQKIKDYILHSKDNGELEIKTDSDGIISHIAYTNDSGSTISVTNL